MVVHMSGDAIRHKPGILGFLRQIGFMGATTYLRYGTSYLPCGKCNQSKGNKNWQEWIVGSARLSPKTRGIKDIDEKIRRIDAYEKQGGVVRVDFETHLSSDLWRRHWDNWKTVLEEMRNAQELADELRKKLATAI